MIHAAADYRLATHQHQQLVARLLHRIIGELLVRGETHDQSKLASPEREGWDVWGPRLHSTVYGTPEYTAAVAAMRPLVAQHYAANRHHPEHYPDGIRGMSLVDLTEMLCDWKAASLRAGGDLASSLDFNQQRFGFSDDLKAILLNTLPLFEPDSALPETGV